MEAEVYASSQLKDRINKTDLLNISPLLVELKENLALSYLDISVICCKFPDILSYDVYQIIANIKKDGVFVKRLTLRSGDKTIDVAREIHELSTKEEKIKEELEGIQGGLSLFRAFTKNLYLVTASLFRASFGKASSSYKTSTRNFH